MRGDIIKGKALILTVILIFACVSVFAYQNKRENPQSTLSNIPDSQNNVNNSFSENKNVNTEGNMTQNNLDRHSNSKINQNENSKKSRTNSNVKKIDSQSIAQNYIEEPNAVAGKPKRYNIGGKSTDVVPVIQDGKQVGEIHIDPKTGENVGGAGGAP